MIAETWMQGAKTGDIRWNCGEPMILKHSCWQPYADFEREKLRELQSKRNDKENSLWINNTENDGSGPVYGFGGHHKSTRLINYSVADFDADFESNRLLKRAEFLRAVCEKEGVEWLPKEQCGCGEPDAPNTKHRIEQPCYSITPEPAKPNNPCTCTLMGNVGQQEVLRKDPHCRIHGQPRDYYTKAEADEKFMTPEGANKKFDVLMECCMHWRDLEGRKWRSDLLTVLRMMNISVEVNKLIDEYRKRYAS